MGFVLLPLRRLDFTKIRKYVNINNSILKPKLINLRKFKIKIHIKHNELHVIFL
jgi:hypothetical protein